MATAADEIKALYSTLAERYKAGDVEAVSSALTHDFVSVGLDGNERDKVAWKKAVGADLDAVNYDSSHISVDKLSVNGDVATAYITKRFVVTNDQGDHFHSDLQAKEELEVTDGGWKIKGSDVIKRKILHNGSPLSITELPVERALMQSCGDPHA